MPEPPGHSWSTRGSGRSNRPRRKTFRKAQVESWLGLYNIGSSNAKPNRENLVLVLTEMG